MRVNQSRQAIPVRPEVVRLLGHDHIAAIYYQQMVYYNDHEPRDTEGYFNKSKTRIERDTALSRFQQDRARRKLVEKGWILSRIKTAKGSQTSSIKVLRTQD